MYFSKKENGYVKGGGGQGNNCGAEKFKLFDD